MTEKQFGTEYGPPLQRNDKAACIVGLQAEIDRLGGRSLWLDEDIRNTSIRLLQSAHRAMFPVSQGDCDKGPMRRQHRATCLEMGAG
jgi:hypothetical protein